MLSNFMSTAAYAGGMSTVFKNASKFKKEMFESNLEDFENFENPFSKQFIQPASGSRTLAYA